MAIASRRGLRGPGSPSPRRRRRARAWRRGSRGQRRGADREQRQAADLIERAGAVEQLEEPRDDVDRDPPVAAGADAAQELLMAGAGEGDDHAVDLAASSSTSSSWSSEPSSPGAAPRSASGPRRRRGRPPRARTPRGARGGRRGGRRPCPSRPGRCAGGAARAGAPAAGDARPRVSVPAVAMVATSATSAGWGRPTT